MSGTCSKDLTPLHVAAAQGCHRCLGLLLRERGRLWGEDGKRAMDLVLEQGWPHTEGRPRRALSFLTEDDTDGSDSSEFSEDNSKAGPLSSTRRSLLEKQELGGHCVPPLWWGCPSEPQVDPRDSALHSQPLASSTLLSYGNELQEGPLSQMEGERTGGPPWVSPKPSVGDIPVLSTQFGPMGSLRMLGGHRDPLPCCGLGSCSKGSQSPGNSDIPRAAAQHCPGVPWAGVGSAAPKMGVSAPTGGVRGLNSSSSGDSSNPGDSSSATECFVTALEPSEARECWGAQSCCSSKCKAAGGLGWGAAPSPSRAVPQELPPTDSHSVAWAQGKDLGGGTRAAPRCESGAGVGDFGELLAQLQRCSLGESLPCTPQSVHSPVGVTAGDVTPQGQEPPRHCHITPRTRSRLHAAAERLNYSSSLFDESLPIPRRLPRIRSPREVPRDPATPSGHCITPRDKDVPKEGREETGSLDDTQILPGATTSPSGGASSCPGSSLTILPVAGDQEHPQSSPKTSPTFLLCPGDPRHPQSPPSGPWGSPHSEVLEGGSECQCHSPLGTPQFQWLHGTSRHLLAPQPPRSAGRHLGTLSVPLSPTSCGTHCSGGHGEDKEKGQAPSECHIPVMEATISPEDATGWDGRVSLQSPPPLSDQSLRRQLQERGDNPGPVTEFTRRLYLRRLQQLAGGPGGEPEGHSPELVATLRTGHIPDCAQDELALSRQFERPDRSRHWREGLVKSSFNYLLLDPRTTQDLPLRSPQLSPAQRFRTFISAVFYVGKGTRARPFCHLAEALGQHRAGTRKGCPKVQRILQIWESGHGVISVLCFQNRVPAEAYTREGCMVEALGLQTLTNQRKGHCYGVAAGWAAERRRRLGVHMLYRAMSIFLAEGERQLRPGDFPGGC